MLNNQKNNLEYINKLENENKILREENTRLKHIVLSGLENNNISLLQKTMQISTLEREIQNLRRQNAMLVLMK